MDPEKLIAVRTNADGTLDEEGKQTLIKELQSILDDQPEIPKADHQRLLDKVLRAASKTGGARLMSEAMETGDALRSIERLISPLRKNLVQLGRALSDSGRARSAFEMGASYGMLLSAGALLSQSADTIRHALTCDCHDDEPEAKAEPEATA